MTEAGVFTFSTGNLGDEMQSLAVLAHLDRVQVWMDRDHLADFQAETDTACVFNCWFLIGNDYRRPAARVQPIWHGFAGWKESLQGEWLPYLKEQSLFHGPIGCRDLYTTELLAEAGVNAQWTGCLTLFLGRAWPRPARERQGIYFVDVPPEVERFIPAEIVRRARRLSSFPAPSILQQPLERWAAAARLAALAAHAELVVTRRLHVALPAASFGTPVVAIPDPGISFARRRFAGFETIIPMVFLDEAESGLKKLDWFNLPPARIPRQLEKQYLFLGDDLRARKLAGGPPGANSPLEVCGSPIQRLRNATQIPIPGRVRLRLKERIFELTVRGWSDRWVEVALPGFPGLSKIDFTVEVCPRETEDWIAWGRLRELAAEPGAGAE
jgi:hypothetical protein